MVGLFQHVSFSIFVSGPRAARDGTSARHSDHALVLYTLCMVQLLAVDTSLPLCDKCVDRLVTIYAFVVFCKS